MIQLILDAAEVFLVIIALCILINLLWRWLE